MVFRSSAPTYPTLVEDVAATVAFVAFVIKEDAVVKSRGFLQIPVRKETEHLVGNKQRQSKPRLLSLEPAV
jgi:hypothetical protein